MGQKLKVAGWLAIGALTGALATVQIQAVARSAMAPLPLEELQQLAAVFSMIKTDYVEPVDEKKLITDAISGMVTALDPHSAFYDKKAWKEFREGTSGSFVGVGIEITMEDGLVKVVSPIEDSPASAAGLRTNDLIARIDNTAVKGLTITEAVKLMRGEPGTQVRLQILRRDENRTFTVTITRARIITQSVKSKILDDGYAWIRISQFQDRTVTDFANKLGDIAKQSPNLKGLVLDLRNDPGGLLMPPSRSRLPSCQRTAISCRPTDNLKRVDTSIKPTPVITGGALAPTQWPNSKAIPRACSSASPWLSW